MSRSFRHTPIASPVGCRSEKVCKSHEHGRWHVCLRSLLVPEVWDVAETDEPTSVWNGPRDGKEYFGRWNVDPAWMRR